MSLGYEQARLDEALAEARTAIPNASSSLALDDLERHFVGRRSPASAANEAIKSLPTADRPAAGRAVQAYRQGIADLVEARRHALDAHETADAARRERVDLTLGTHTRRRGHLHLVTQIRRELEDIFVGLGYQIAEGPEVEDDWHNFEALNFPPAHPARSMQDTLYVHLGDDEQVMLRTHTSPVQIRTLETHPPPDLRRRARPRLPQRDPRRPPLARSSTRWNAWPSTAASPWPTCSAPSRRSPAASSTTRPSAPGSAPTTSPTPSRPPSSRSAACSATARAAGSAPTPAGSSSAAAGWSTPTCSPRSTSTPRSGTGFAFGFGLDRLAMIRYGIDEIKHLRRQRHPLPRAVLMPCAHRCPGSATSPPSTRPSTRSSPPSTGSASKSKPSTNPAATSVGVRVARVLEVTPHPDADRLRLAEIDDGARTTRVVCGAPNVHADMLAAVRPLRRHPPRRDHPRTASKIRGQISDGMLCSPAELGLGDDHSGILDLEPDLTPGTDVREVLGLDDVIFDLAITPNRPDAMCVVGVARELAAHFHLPLQVRAPAAPGSDFERSVGVVLEAPDRCPRYLARVAAVTMGESPTWMRQRLTKAGMRPISNVVDVTNYVLLERNQPLHAFDLDRLAGPGIVVRLAEPGERITTLDGVPRPLEHHDLLICDADRVPQAIAGIMGGGDCRGVGHHHRDPPRVRLLRADGHRPQLEAAQAALRGQRPLRARHRPRRRPHRRRTGPRAARRGRRRPGRPPPGRRVPASRHPGPDPAPHQPRQRHPRHHPLRP